MCFCFLPVSSDQVPEREPEDSQTAVERETRPTSTRFPERHGSAATSGTEEEGGKEEKDETKAWETQRAEI